MGMSWVVMSVRGVRRRGFQGIRRRGGGVGRGRGERRCLLVGRGSVGVVFAFLRGVGGVLVSSVLERVGVLSCLVLRRRSGVGSLLWEESWMQCGR